MSRLWMGSTYLCVCLLVEIATWKEVDGKNAWNDTGLGPRHPAGCAVKTSKQYTPLIILNLVALAGLAVIVAINVIISKCRNATRGPSKKRDKCKNHSEQVDMDLADTTTVHNTSDTITGSSSGLQLKHELKTIVIQPSNTRGAQEDSHHGCLEVHNYDNITSFKSTAKDYNNQNKEAHTSGESLQQHMDSQGPGDAVNEEKTRVLPELYATVEKSQEKTKTTEVVYAKVNKSTKKKRKQDLVTYAELAEFNHDATRGTSKAQPPPYHHTEYASISSVSFRCQDK